MTFIVEIFKWLYKGIVTVLKWIISFPGMIITFVSTVAGSIATIITKCTEPLHGVKEISDSAISNIDSVANSEFLQSDVFQTLSYALSLDVAWDYITSLIGILCGILGLALISFGVALFVTIIQGLIVKSVIRLATITFPMIFR